MREEGLLKLFFAGVLPPEEAVETLRAMREHRLGSPSGCAPWSRRHVQKDDPFPLMVLQGGIEFNEWFADWCERMEAQLLDAARRRKEQLMFDALARLADGNARRIGLFAIVFFVLAGAIGGWRRQPPRPLRRRRPGDRDGRRRGNGCRTPG